MSQVSIQKKLKLETNVQKMLLSVCFHELLEQVPMSITVALKHTSKDWTCDISMQWLSCVSHRCCSSVIYLYLALTSEEFSVYLDFSLLSFVVLFLSVSIFLKN